MPEIMSLTLIIGIICYLASLLLFWLTKDISDYPYAIDAWCIAALAGVIGYAALLLGSSYYPTLAELTYNIAMLFWAISLSNGSIIYLKHRPLTKLLYISGIIIAITVIASFNFISTLVANILLALYVGSLTLSLGIQFIRMPNQKISLQKVLGGLLILNGLHWYDYPLLRPNPDFSPIGFLLCAMLSMTVTALIVKMVLRDFYTKMHIAQQKAISQALRDPLTHVGNRTLLVHEFPNLLQNAKQAQQDIALIFCDLNKFKQINDTYGHSVGDTALIMFAKRISSVARQSDLVVRLGGDEFVVVLSGLEYRNYQIVTDFISRLTTSMKNPFPINGLDHYLDTSIGVAYLSKHGESLEHLLHVADEAMYADKTIKRHNLSINKSIDLNIESPIKIPKDPSLNTIIQL